MAQTNYYKYHCKDCDDEALNLKKEYCTMSLVTADDKKKEPEHSIAGLESIVAKAKDALAVTKEGRGPRGRDQGAGQDGRGGDGAAEGR